MSSVPPPSQLCLLSALPQRRVGDKVRFLGCVKSYSPASGVLNLEHRLLEDTSSVVALVDVNLVLESLGAGQTRNGEWVNVIGYITDINHLADCKGSTAGHPKICVQALLIWSAGPVDTQRYTASLRALHPEKHFASRQNPP
ncbi:Protein ten1 [Madurella mycetomatis]|uniref:Protein ten1 n=1 Tax=Madurella mycetomatis TaxID=100816 RepID=A0A175VYW2_9PEZI|nr:Protein ten1 [Madurella mycetomatis]